jgi:2'-5' RNA ligase
VRLFVTVEAPEAWRAEAVAQQEALLDALPPDTREALRVVSAELMHVTLRFLGEVEEEIVAPLQTALGRVAAPEIALTLARAGTFGAPASIWAVYLGIEGDLDALRALAAGVEEVVASLGLPREARPLTAHLTLARVRRSATAEARRAVDAAVGDLAPPPPRPHVARGIALVRSYLGGAEPRYEVLSRHP